MSGYVYPRGTVWIYVRTRFYDPAYDVFRDGYEYWLTTRVKTLIYNTVEKNIIATDTYGDTGVLIGYYGEDEQGKPYLIE